MRALLTVVLLCAAVSGCGAAPSQAGVTPGSSQLAASRSFGFTGVVEDVESDPLQGTTILRVSKGSREYAATLTASTRYFRQDGGARVKATRKAVVYGANVSVKTDPLAPDPSLFPPDALEVTILE